MADEILTITELAKYLKLKPRTLYIKVKRGEIPGSRIGRTWRFQKSLIDKWLEDSALERAKNSI